MFLLIDCNNFFASVEQVFAPKLRNRPLVVLSSGDGCAIARSREAKALGIPMGAPVFKYKDLFLKHDVAIRSCNFPLYGDMSRRVMTILAGYGLDLEIYSIDEAFLFSDFETGLVELADKMRAQIKKWTGIEVSIGIAPTKTLAKMATKIAKSTETGVYILDSQSIINKHLHEFDVGDVWGIGWRLKTKLNSYGIKTAYDLISKNDTWIKKQVSIVGLRTVYELRGTSCLKLDEIAPQKSILRSRTFSIEIGQLSKLEEKIAGFAETIATRLRKHGLVCQSICTFAASNRHKIDTKYVSDSYHLHFNEQTSYTPLIIAKAKEGLTKIFQKGVLYKRAGVMVYGLTDENSRQKDLFGKQDLSEMEKKNLMKAYDRINVHYGTKSLYFAAEGIYEKHLAENANKSKCYTTSWNELLQISLGK